MRHGTRRGKQHPSPNAHRGIERLENRVLLSAVDVLTQHNDNARTGANLSETVLNTSNVNVNSFGRLYSRPVDDQIYAQPLYVTNVPVPGKGTHNLIIVATVNDSIYAFDADDASVTDPYWTRSFIDPTHGVRPVHNTDVGQNCGSYQDFSGKIGIVSTPVIDRASNTIYLLARTVENGAFVQRLHALDLSTGADKVGGSVVISASVPGTGDGSVNGIVSFNPQTENQRAALTLDNGTIVIGWASHCDTGPYHGWIIGYNAATLQQTFAFATTPNGSEAGVWMSGQGFTVDSAGNLYFTDGNGSVGPTQNNYGEAFIKLSPTGQLLDYFIPSNWSSLNGSDADLGSGGVLLIPGTNEIVGGGKEGKLFLLDSTNMGKLHTPDQSIQEFQVTPSANNDHIHGAPVYYQDANGNQFIYVWGMSDTLKQFQFANGKFVSTTPFATSNVTVAPTPSQPGGLLSVSADGTTPGTGIVWAMSTLGPSANQSVQPGIFRAFDASNVSHELWNSQQDPNRDDFGNLAKFNYPTIDNGHVYLPTFSNQLVVYGLLANQPATPRNFTATLANPTEIDLSWSAVPGATQYVLERKGGGTNFVPLATLPAGTLSYQDTNIVGGGTTYTYRLRARNANGDSAPATATVQTQFVRLLLMRLKFDEGTGTTAADSSGNGNTGTLGSGAGWTAGKINSAASFDGTANAYVQVADSPSLDPTNQISVAAWVDATTWANGNHRILQKGLGDNQYRLTEEGGVLKWDLFGVGTVTAAVPTTGAWHQITGTYDGAAMTLYIDGASVGSVQTAGGSLPVTSDPLYIGTKAIGGTVGNHFSGAIDDVRVYNYALTATQVQTLANDTAPPAAPSNETVAPSSSSSINVHWQDNSSDEEGFVLERKTGAGGAYSPIAQLGPNVTSYTDTGLSPSTTYFYRVKAFNIFDDSPYAPEQQATTPGTSINALVGEWKFDEAGGATAADSSGNGNTGTLVGGPAFSTDTPDASAHSLSLNGTTQWMRVNDSASLEPSGAITLAAWVKASDWSGTRPIISKGAREGSYFLTADAGLLKFNLSGQGTLTAPLPSAGVWHHIAATYDGMTMAIYIDGLLVTSQSATGALATSGDPLFVGGSAASTTTGQAFAGLIDDARVYNFAITPRQISALYGNVAWWKFNEGSGGMAEDTSPNRNTLSLSGSGATWMTGRDGFAVALNGTSGYLQALDNQVLNPTSAISLAAWINASDWNDAPRILQKGDADNQYALLAENGRLEFNLAGVGSVSAPLPSTHLWHHVLGTYDGSTIKLYVDGAVVASAAATGSIATTTDPLEVGTKGPGTPGTFFHGLLDDVRIFSRALTEGEAATLAFTLPGDANRDGKVDFSDLLILAQNYGKTGARVEQGDFNHDGTVGFADLLLLAQNYNHQSAAARLGIPRPRGN